MGQDFFTDEVNDVSQTPNEALTPVEAHERLHAEGAVLIIIALVQFSVESVAQRAIIACIVSRDSQKFRGNLEFLKQSVYNFGHALARALLEVQQTPTRLPDVRSLA
jgi:hypothetical protein